MNPHGSLHGAPCTRDDECLYGFCHESAAVASFGFCTKECACGRGSSCADDEGGGMRFACQHLDPEHYPGETVESFCTRVCETVADCPPGYNRCERLTGSTKVCLER